ncbi:MAG: hypothetical protein K2N70_07450, partial [Helicobacter sp.]|nr:hypothetical protein [Helicobacter sp.]
PQSPSTLFKCGSARTMPMLHSASSMLCLRLEHRRCALWLIGIYARWHMQQSWNPKRGCATHARAFLGDFLLVDCFAYARNDTMSATKVAPPNKA